MNILWITNMPTIYRVNFFNELGVFCDLDVVFERYSASGVENYWREDLAKNFNPFFINSINIGREGSFSLGLLKYRLKKYDLIVISSYSSPTEMLMILKLLITRKKFVLAVDGGFIKSDSFLLKHLKKFFVGNASWWLSTSKKTDEYLTYYGARKNKIYRYPFTTLYNKEIISYPIIESQKKILRKKLDVQEKKVILAVGQFIDRKGFDILIKSCQDIDESVGVYIVGGSPTKEYINLVNSLELKNIHFIEKKSKEDLAEYYKMADLFVLPTREDIWGLVVNEAMSFGLPVVTTANCIAGIELVKDNENGFIVPVEDSKALSNKINLILSNKNLRNKMSKGSLKKIKRYTLENMAFVNYQIFEKIIQEKDINSDESSS